MYSILKLAVRRPPTAQASGQATANGTGHSCPDSYRDDQLQPMNVRSIFKKLFRLSIIFTKTLGNGNHF
jgi:hypothetical protein